MVISASRAPWQELLEKRRLEILKIKFEPVPYDLTAQCPRCKTVETLQFVESTMVASRKFVQKGNYIYHDCGSEVPCRLMRA